MFCPRFYRGNNWSGSPKVKNKFRLSMGQLLNNTVQHNHPAVPENQNYGDIICTQRKAYIILRYTVLLSLF